ncbi:hypothetical protein GWI33_003194 [Rhynchophorus ferrugineus]|uniref:Uncharacterized protein n=1 Tax=Rhynchophorus ferrugineus TaxID=354439 RepID=A0A834IZF2_RHYFE|nr:hypothetical protein GWI33_003194 [Rhynchophorus ferrugineus]
MNCYPLNFGGFESKTMQLSAPHSRQCRLQTPSRLPPANPPSPRHPHRSAQTYNKGRLLIRMEKQWRKVVCSPKFRLLNSSGFVSAFVEVSASWKF